MTRGLPERINRYAYLARSYGRFLLTGKALAFPSKIQIQTKSLCNGHCQFCPYPEISRQLEQGTMARELFEKIVDELLSTKNHITLMFELHNEPLLDERIFDFIKYVKTRNAKIACNLVTNGQLLDRFSLQEVKQSAIDRIVISLNAHSREMYQSLNCGLDYDKIINNIYLLISDDSLKQKLTLSFVLTRQAAKEVPQALRYWKNMGVKTRIIELQNRAGTLANYDSMRLKTNNIKFTLLERAGRYMIARTLNIIGCYDPFFHMNILFNGDVILCCDDWKRDTIVGNIRDKSIKEVWNLPRMNEIRRLILKKKYDQISSCKECSKAKK